MQLVASVVCFRINAGIRGGFKNQIEQEEMVERLQWAVMFIEVRYGGQKQFEVKFDSLVVGQCCINTCTFISGVNILISLL
jgi:hypothetical protein